MAAAVAASVTADLGELRTLAEDAARAAGEELLARQGHVTGLGAKTSSTDPVSDADRASEALLVGALLGARPDDGVLGEEGADREGSSGIRWVIDPLDGTVNYLYGLGGWAVSVAAEDADGALVGVVHDPGARETFVAVRGQGACLEGRPLRVDGGVAPAWRDDRCGSTGASPSSVR